MRKISVLFIIALGMFKISHSQTTATDYYPWSTMHYTVNTISEYDDDNSILIQLTDQYGGGQNVWMLKTDNINLAILLSAKSAGLDLFLAFDNATASQRKYTQDSPNIVAARLKKFRVY